MDTGGQLPEEHALMVVLEADPVNLYRAFEPSVDTVIVTVQDGTADTVCALPSKAILDGLTSHPVNVPVPVGAPFAVEIVV